MQLRPMATSLPSSVASGDSHRLPDPAHGGAAVHERPRTAGKRRVVHAGWMVRDTYRGRSPARRQQSTSGALSDRSTRERAENVGNTGPTGGGFSLLYNQRRQRKWQARQQYSWNRWRRGGELRTQLPVSMSVTGQAPRTICGVESRFPYLAFPPASRRLRLHGIFFQKLDEACRQRKTQNAMGDKACSENRFCDLQL